MADSKITALTALTAADPVNDMFPVVDVSDTSMAASGTTKRISANNILSSSPTASGALTVTGLVTAGSANVTGDLTVDTSTLKVDSTNNRVGILTATPGAPLDIFTNNLADAILIRGNDNANVRIRMVNSGAGGEEFALSAGIPSASNSSFVIRSVTAASNRYVINQTGEHAWATNAGTAMTLNSTGLGIGGSVTNKLTVNNTAATGAVSFLSTGTTTAYNLGQFSNTGGSLYFGVDNSAGSAISGATAYGSIVGSSNSTNLHLITNNTVRATVDTSGNLHVGTTAHLNTGSNIVNSLNGFNIVPDNTANAANRNWNIAANGGAAGNLDFVISSANNTFPNSAYRMQLTSAGALNNTTGTYGTISDLRLKENISDARNYLADLLKLRVVKYSLKEESSAVATKLGFIAQEVELVFPNLVDQSDKEYDGAEGIRSVKTSILIPMLLKAIQELTARVQTLEAR